MNNKTSQVVTRIAPSPTGLFHVGSARVALTNYLFAKQHNGRFLLRIEDTDTERNKPEWTEMIYSSLQWLGLEYEMSYIQSERTAIYQKYIEKLIADGFAYISQEVVTEPGQRAEVIRFKNPNKKVRFNDLIRGEIEFDTTDLKDFVIAKSLTEPIFHLTNVIDDFESGITHVIRGEEHISNTPRQILIWEAIGGTLPIYAHIPLLLSETREKLSKRKHGELVSIDYYRRLGYLPQAFVNFIALLGWNPGTDQELFTLDELVKAFDISKVQKGGAIFNPEKLLWFNKEYLKRLPVSDIREKMLEIISEKFSVEDNYLTKIIPILQERISTFGELKTLFTAGEYDYLFIDPTPTKDALIWKKDTDFAVPATNLEAVKTLVIDMPESGTREEIQALLDPLAIERGKGSVLWPLRMSLTGKDKSPDPYTLLATLPKETSLRRIENAIAILQK